MSLLPLLLRIVLTVVLVTPGAGGCAVAATTADRATTAVAADLPPCHTDHVTDAASAPAATDPAPDGHDDSDGCGNGNCDCGCPCRALTALAGIPAAPSATLPESPSSATRPAPRSGTPPPPPTPPPIG